MNIKILVAAHKKYRMPEDKIYFPVQVGSYGKENIGFARDDEGDNISQKNPYFCELTGLYWIWKNVDADYYGLVHYRRYFSAVPKIKRTSHDKFRYILDEATLENILKDYDIVVPKKRKYFIESLYSHYAHTHYEEHILITEKVIKEICPDYEASFKKVMKSSSAHMFNMMIMSKEKFNENVFLYDYEYKKLLEEYGENKTKKCIEELSLYKKSKGVEYESDYATIKRFCKLSIKLSGMQTIRID